MSRYHLYGVGNALVDLEYRVTELELISLGLQKGVMTLAAAAEQQALLAKLARTPDHQVCGGSAANTIVAAQRFGAHCYYTCRVAEDGLGDFYRADLANLGVDSRQTQLLEGITGTCVVLVTPDAERTLHTHLGITASLMSSDINHDAIASSEWVYLEGYLAASPTGQTAAVYAHQLARQHNVKVALTFSDPNMVQYCREGLQAMLSGGVDLLFCNEKEAQMWTQETELTLCLQHLQGCASSVVMTCGARGALISHQGQLLRIAPVQVQAVDTNGAGDMFAGAFLYAITAGWDWSAAGELASRASAYLVTQMGPRLTLQQQRTLLQSQKLPA